MPIDPDVPVGATLPEIPFTWTESDVLLYHLAVGAGAAPGDNLSRQALRWTVEGDRLQVLPSFGIVAPTFHLTEPATGAARLRHRPVAGAARHPGDRGPRADPDQRLGHGHAPGSPTSGTRAARR